MVNISIDVPEFSILLGGLIRMAQAAKVSREQAMELARKAEDAGSAASFEGFMDIAAHKQTIIDQCFATLSAVGKSAREQGSKLVLGNGERAAAWRDDPEILDALKWAADMWSEVVGEHPILNADGTVYQRPNRSE